MWCVMEENGRRERPIEKTTMSQPLEQVREEIVALLPRLRRFARARRERLFAPAAAGENVGDLSADLQVEVLSVQAAMACLPEDQRVAIALVLIEGLSYKEAAGVMDVPIGTLTR